MAIVQVPVIYDNLGQSPDDTPCLDAFRQLANAMKAAAVKNDAEIDNQTQRAG